MSRAVSLPNRFCGSEGATIKTWVLGKMTSKVVLRIFLLKNPYSKHWEDFFPTKLTLSHHLLTSFSVKWCPDHPIYRCLFWWIPFALAMPLMHEQRVEVLVYQFWWSLTSVFWQMEVDSRNPAITSWYAFIHLRWWSPDFWTINSSHLKKMESVGRRSFPFRNALTWQFAMLAFFWECKS